MPDKNAWAYLVRIWREPGEGGGVWRASLTDLATRQVRYFADYASLLRYIQGIAGPLLAPDDGGKRPEGPEP